ncbi:MAG TPA: NYN domain-containing protein [Novosphingobium sp.]|nr:NYN domain-containing protein [Novosphingobium sp.]HNN56707.1 NYN domain-containing protein [Novosphingobium sp.]
MRTRVYVDGYNLYYACLKGTPHKWLNIHALAAAQLPKNQIERVRYFTARVRARPHDPTQPQRQETYFRALSSVPEIDLHFGHFLTHEVGMPDAAAWNAGQYRSVRVIKTEEKGSDVNLATHLLMDAFDNLFDVAVIMSNDSDLAEPMRLIKQRFGKTVGLLSHRSTRVSGKLRPLVDFVKSFHSGALLNAQFPSQMTDANGNFSRPPTW